MAKAYGNNSIERLKGAETIRRKPSSMLGSDGIEGACHTLEEILANALDEARNGFGRIITLVKHKDNSITIMDEGRGCPVDWNENEKEYNYELVFMTLYAGGKYNSIEEENYGYALGTNGLGATATQFTSKFMNVEVIRDGYKYTLHFEKGELVGEMKKEKTSETKTGTKIHWLPDDEVFVDNNIPVSFIVDLLNRQAIVNKGIELIFVDEANDKITRFYYENGILDHIKRVSKGKEFSNIITFEKETRGKDREDRPEYKLKIELIFCFNNEHNLLEYYHNAGYLPIGGSPDRAVKSAFTFAIDKYLKDNNKYNKKEDNDKSITFDDIKESLILISNTQSTMTSYLHQTKTAITNNFIHEYMNSYIREQLAIYFIENKEEAEKICNQILINKRAREKAGEDRTKIRKKLESTIKNAVDKPEKYVDCRSKDKTKRRITVIEGDSALSAVKQARDKEYDAIYPLKGKPMNCLKKSIDKIIDNPEIFDFVRLLGCGVTYKGRMVKGLPNFDLNNLEFSEINILSDGDDDGMHIRCLMIGMFYMLMPDVIKAEKVKIIEAPLYRITQNEKEWICYDEVERNNIISNITGKYEETRFKGLGGLNPQLSANTILSMENRRVNIVTMEDADECIKVLEMFLDDDNTDRKNYIAEHGHKYFDYSIYED